jgi:Non-repetitive/WGA-negative nucleoporin C-terminal
VLLPLTFLCRFNLSLDKRIEYLTLAVNNAKSHPSSEFGRHETAVEFLTDLEEKLEVAQVQREIYHSLAAKLGAPKGEDALRFRHIQNMLLNITQVWLSPADVTSTNALGLAIQRLCRSLRVVRFQASHLQGLGSSGPSSHTCDMGGSHRGKYVLRPVVKPISDDVMTKVALVPHLKSN